MAHSHIATRGGSTRRAGPSTVVLALGAFGVLGVWAVAVLLLLGHDGGRGDAERASRTSANAVADAEALAAEDRDRFVTLLYDLDDRLALLERRLDWVASLEAANDGSEPAGDGVGPGGAGAPAPLDATAIANLRADIEAELAEIRAALNDRSQPQPNRPFREAEGSEQPAPFRPQPEPRPRRQTNNPNVASWDTGHARGAPDAELGQDHPNAWATRERNRGIEWLEVDFERDLAPDTVIIRESLNPGAVVKVEAVMQGADWSQTIWEGDDPTREPGDFVIDVTLAIVTRTLRITLDTQRVDGWNEIDAVGIVMGAETYWAVEARASSSYARR